MTDTDQRLDDHLTRQEPEAPFMPPPPPMPTIEEIEATGLMGEITQCHECDEMILNDQLDQAMDHLRALLAVKWISQPERWERGAFYDICPWCKGERIMRHAPDCPRQAAAAFLKALD